MAGISILVGWPLLFSSRTFGGDWPLHVLLVESQIEAISAGFFPTFFSNFPQVGFFYPTGFFLGGNFYALLGYLGILTGPFWAIAFSTIFLLFYVQISWRGITRSMSRNSFFTLLPGFVFITSAYFLGDLFGRGGISSVFAISGVPIFAYSILENAKTAKNLRHKLGILVGVILIFATHNVSTLWIVCHLLIWTLVLFFVASVNNHPAKRIIEILNQHKSNTIIVIASVLITSWAMIPNLYFASRSDIAQNMSMQKEWSRSFNDPRNLFNLIRGIPPEHQGTDLFVQFPTLIFLTCLAYIIGASLKNQLEGKDKLGILICIASISGTLVMIYALDVYDYLPQVFMSTQFTFRLNHFLYLAVTALVSIIVSIQLRKPKDREQCLDRVVFTLLTTFICLSVIQGVSQSSFSNKNTPGDRSSRSIEYWGSFWYSENDLRTSDGLSELNLNPEINLPSVSFVNGKLTFPINALLVGVPTQGPLPILDFCGGEPIGHAGKLLILSYQESPSIGCIQSKWSPATSAGVTLSILGLLVFVVKFLLDYHLWRIPRRKKERMFGAKHRKN
jgi:hypothetical protein